jgi:hypothetical protein
MNTIASVLVGALHWLQLGQKSDLPNWREWSLKHGQFVVVDPDQKDTKPNEQNGIVLTLDYFKGHRSNARSKVIAILQTTWARLLIVSLPHVTAFSLSCCPSASSGSSKQSHGIEHPLVTRIVESLQEYRYWLGPPCDPHACQRLSRSS